ncbi:hypothetical protein KXD40_006738 [Peronospora effusa]|uniref:SCP domain-containing protein n=1 Tax=Peronospora effusa TaxID=542832 RepID=A0A3M6VKE4_9STRA|nr:hypothetical protein DD238_004005 [Peronospora effusa]UIZ24881.1 hypothetical protein KXD40_006738 [Peronospora effusa]
MMIIPQSSLALLLLVAAASNGFSKAAILRRPNLGGTTTPTNVETYKTYEDYAYTMLAAVNKQRATKGLSSLCLNKKLHIVAQVHSDDMAANDFMAHVGSDGSTMPQRVTRAGYNWTSVAENVAAGYVTVDDVMQGWIGSPEHLENIMGDYTMFASAYAFNGHDTYQHYWSQEFGTSDTETCDDGYASSALTPQQDATQHEVQGEAKTVMTPSPTTARNAIATKSPAIEAPVTNAYDSVMPSLATPTPATDIPEGKDCQYEVQYEAKTALTPDPTTATDSLKGKDCESNF